MTIEQEEFDLQQAKEELNNIDYMFPYADPEYKDMARKAAQRRVDILQLRVNRKKNIALNTELQNEAMYEEAKAKEAEEFASKPWLERAGDMATNYFLRRTGGGALKIPGYVAQGVGFTSRALYGDNQTGRDIQQFGRYLNNEVDDFIDSGTGVRSEWFNDEQTAPESVLGRFAGSAYNTVNSLADLESAMGAIGRVGGALGGGSLMSKIPAKLKPAVEGLGFAAMNIPEHSDYIEQKSGKFKPGLATISGTLNGVLMSYAFALGRGGLNMTEAQAMNFARESVRKGTFDLTKDAFKQALKTAVANGSMTGLGGGAFKNLSTLNMDDDPQKYWNDLKNAALNTLKEGGREAVMGGVFGFKGAFDKAISDRQTYSNMRERGKVLLGEKPAEARTLRETLKQAVRGDFKGVKETFSKIWSPEINDKAFDTGVNEYFFGKEGAKLRGNPEEAEKLFAGPKQNIDTFVEKVRENLPQDSVSLKDPGAVESALKAYKASLYIERNNTLLDRLAKDRGIDLNTIKEAYDKGNLRIKENGDVVGYLVGKVEDIKLELKNTNDTINKLDVTIKSKDVDLQAKQEAAQQKEEALLRQEELYRKVEKPYTRAEVIEAVRDMVARKRANDPETLNRVNELLSRFLLKDRGTKPIDVDDAVALLIEVDAELNKIISPKFKEGYNSDIEDIISPKLIGNDVIYGRDERNMPTSVIPTDYTEPRQIGYDGIIYGNDERSTIPEERRLGYDGAIYPEMVSPLDTAKPLSVRGNEKPIMPEDVINEQNRIRATQSPTQNVTEFPTNEFWYPSKDYKGRENTPPSVRTKNGRESLGIKDNIKSEPSVQLNDKTIAEMKNNGSLNIEQAPNGDYFVTGRLNNGQPIVASGLDLDTASKVITSLRETKSQDRPKMEMPKTEEMSFPTKPKEQFPINDNIGDKVNRAEQSAFPASVSSLDIPQAVAKEAPKTEIKAQPKAEAKVEAKTKVKQAKPKAELESQKPDMSEKPTDSKKPATEKSSAVENIVRGKKTKMTTKANGGMKVDGEFAVVDVNKLKTATDIGKTQNRNRKTVASQAQVNSIANNPNPEYLIVDNPDSANGAMVISSDGTVLSGNGRTLGLSEAYKYGNADKYKAYLKEHAPEFGIDPREIDKIENPVLVRIVDSKNGFDVKRFVKESNESRQLGRNAAETARTDAENIKGILREFNNIDDIASPSNKEFIQKFFEKTVGDTERANYLAEDGSLTQDGQRRIENALIASLYGDNPRLIEKLANTTNTGIKNVAKALIATAKDGAKLKGEIDKGMYFDVDLNKEISDAALTYADTVAEMHRQGVNGSPINFYLANMKDRLTPEGKLVFGMLSELNNKPKQVREFLQIINDVIRGHGDPQQGDLFAGKNPKPNKLQIIKEALQAFDSRYGTDFSKQDLSKWNKSERTLFDIGNEVREDGTPASVKKFVPDYKNKKKSSWTKEDWEDYDNDQIKIANDILGEENTDTTPIEKTNDIKLSKQQQNMYKSLKEFLPDIFEVYDREAESPAPVQALMNILRGGESLADIETAITRGDSREAIDIIKSIKQRVELTYSKDFSNRIAKNCDRLIKMIKNSNYRSNAIKPISLEELEAQPINRMPQEDVESWREGRELYVADKRETEPSKQSKREYADIARNVAELYREGKITKEQRKYFYDNLKPEYDFNLDVDLKKLEDYQKEIVSREREKLKSSEAFLVQSLNKGLISFNDFVERRRKLSIDYHDSLWKSGILTNGIRRQIVDPNRYKPQLSRTKDKATNPVTDKELNNFLRGQAKQITKETGLNFKVVDSVDELRKMFPNNDITDTVEGGIHNDTVYLVRGNIDRDRLPLVIAHEVAGHRGVESLFENKQQMDNFFNSLERAAVKDKFIRDAFAEVDRLGYKENRSREAMAKIVEKVRNESGTLKGTAKTFVNFITSRVRRLLRRMGFKNLQLSEAEVYDIAVQALRRTGLKNSNKFFGLDRFLAKDNSFLSATSTESSEREQLDKLAEKAGYNIKAYHGTDKEFDVFKPNNAQGWGKGIYFASEKSDAENYGKNVKEFYISLKNPFDPSDKKANEILDSKAPNTETYKKMAKKTGISDYVDLMNELSENNVEAYRKIIEESGFDGIKAYKSNDINGWEYVIFNPEQAKLADLKTFKDGKEVPLEDRFNKSKADIQFSIGERKPRKVKPDVVSEAEKKILDEIGEVKNPRDYNAVKKIAKNRMAEYQNIFSTKKNTGYTTAALKLHYLLGFDRKTQSVEKAFQSIRDFNTLQKTASAYARSIIGDKSTQASILDGIVKAKTFEKVYDIISKTNIAKEREIRKDLLDDFRNTIKELNPKKISTPTRMYTDEILGESFTPEELDSLIHSNEFTTKAVGKLRNIADNLASELGNIRNSDIEVSEYAINNAARLKHELNEIIKQRDAGNGAMNVPVEKLAEVNQLLKRFVNQDKLYKESLDTSAKNAAVADREQILSESPEKNPKTVNSRETNSIGRFKEYILPGKALKTQDNENVAATMGKTMHKVAYEDLLEGQNRQDHYRATGYKGVDRIMESFGKDLEDGREYLDKTAFKVKTSEGHEYEITNNEALAIIANYLDRETGQMIKKAGKVNFYLGEKKDSDYFTFTRKELDDMMNKLTPKQKKAIEDGFALLSNDFLPELNRVYEKLNGVPLRLIQGRYFPRMHVDVTQSGSNGLITRDRAPYIHQQMNADYQGILKQRDAMATPNLNLRGFTDTLQNYTDQASLYIGMAEPLRHLNRIMNGQMKRELTARYGAEYVNRINQMVGLMAGMAGKTEVDKGFAARYLSNLAAAKLTPLSAIKQLTSVPLASSVIPAEYLAKASISGMSNENIKEMMELDGMILRYRSNGIAGIIPVNAKTWGRERIQGEKFKGQKLIDKAVGVGLNLSLMADKRALGIIYKATKLWAESQGKGSDKAWIENKFMEAVRRTQNTTDLASATGWQMDSRESGTMAFLNMYLNQTQKVSNEFFRNKRLMDEAAKKYGKDSAQYKEARNRTATFAASAALMEAMMLAIGSGASMLFKGKDEDSVKDKAITAVSDLTGNPLLKPMINAYSLQGVLKGKKPTNAAVFGDDFSGMIPEITYTMGRVMNDLQSDDPAARKFRKLSYDMLSSKAAETSLALGRVPTWLARYPAKFIKRIWGEDLKNTRQKPSTSSFSGSSRLFSGKRTFGNSRTFGGKRMF